jgi:dynein heavy chain 2
MCQPAPELHAAAGWWSTGVVEEQLSEVQPMLDAARAAVGSIKADNINEIRSLRMAPDAIRDVLEGVMLLMGQEDTSWSNMKTFLGKKSVKDDLINYDAHRWGGGRLGSEGMTVSTSSDFVKLTSHLWHSH